MGLLLNIHDLVHISLYEHLFCRKIACAKLIILRFLLLPSIMNIQ